MCSDINVAILGLGFGATVQLPAFQSIEGVKVVALCDSGSGKMTPGDLEMSGGRIFHNYKEVVSSKCVDAISVATPPHLQTEKPFGRNLKDAEIMYHKAKQSSLVHTVDFEFRMEPGIRAIKSELLKGTVGEVIRIDVSWLTGGGSDPLRRWAWQHDANLGGGVLCGFGSHIIDYIQWITDSTIEIVYGHSEILVPFRKDASGYSAKVTGEDSMDLICELSNGCTANLRFSNCFPYSWGHCIEVYGKRGRIIFRHGKPFTPERMLLQVENDSCGLRSISLPTEKYSLNLDSRFMAFRAVAELFLRAVRGYSDPDLPTFEAGLSVQNVMDGVRRSVTSKSSVRISSLVDD
jgi:predicted dehydrogenase